MCPFWNGVTVGFKDTTTVQGALNKVFYCGNWPSNSANTWGRNGASLKRKFKGTGIRLFAITNPSNGTADVYLDRQLVGEANYLNNSKIQ